MADHPFRMRIVGEEEVPPGQLFGNPSNFKVHGTFQKQALTGVLREVGWVQRIIVNRTTGHILDGHARVQVALQHNESLVPVVYVEVSEAEEKLLLASLDTLVGLADTDSELLSQLLQDVQSSDLYIQQMLSELAAREGVVPKAEPDAPGEFPKYDESIPIEHTCPRCGYQWSGGEGTA